MFINMIVRNDDETDKVEADERFVERSMLIRHSVELKLHVVVFTSPLTE